MLGWALPLLKYSLSYQCTLASFDGDILYFHLLGRVLSDSSLWHLWWFEHVSKVSTQIIPIVNLGIPRLPAPKSDICPYGIRKLNQMK